MFIGSSAGNRFSGPLTVSGPHTILVYLMRNAARRGETANYTLTIGVKGGAAKASADALVAGTKYNATADMHASTRSAARPARAGAVLRWKGRCGGQFRVGGRRHRPRDRPRLR
jgi:hypothetical protein